MQDDGASNQAEASDDKALQREPASCAEAIRVGWCEVDHGGSGDCGWRALADNWAWRKDGNALSAKDSIQNGNWFRTASVRHIRSHADKYRAGIPGADVSEDAWSAFLQEGGTSAEQFKQKADEALEAYLERAVRPGHWICARLLQATADRLGTAICVWKIGEGSAGDRRFVIAPAFSRGWPKTNPKSPPLVVILRNNHYSSLRTPQEGSVPWTWLRETQALKADDLPGGAKQRDQGSVSASKGDVESEAASVSLHTLCPESAQEDRVLKPHQALKASSTAAKAPENDTAQRPPAPSEATPSLHTMAGPETLQIQNAPKRARLCSHTEASVSLRTLAPNTTAQQPQPAPGSARVSLAQEPTLDREFVVSSAAGPSVAPARRRLKFKQHPLGDEADMGHDPLTFSEKSGHRKNRVSTVKWPCPICHVVFTWTGHDKALSQKQHHMKLVHNTRLSAVGGSRSEKMKKQWQQNPLQFKTGAEATKKAMLRAKQLQDQQRHDLAHATSRSFLVSRRLGSAVGACPRALLGSSRKRRVSPRTGAGRSPAGGWALRGLTGKPSPKHAALRSSKWTSIMRKPPLWFRTLVFARLNDLRRLPVGLTLRGPSGGATKGTLSRPLLSLASSMRQRKRHAQSLKPPAEAEAFARGPPLLRALGKAEMPLLPLPPFRWDRARGSET